MGLTSNPSLGCLATTFIGYGVLSFTPSAMAADDAAWKAASIADAEQAAPPSVTQSATIYAWTDKGEMVLVRDGPGPYTCVASGAFSLRIGKPALPFPDPMCMDQNSWAFVSALWAEKDPTKPSKPYLTAPGIVWMLAGMSAQAAQVTIGGKVDPAMAKETAGGKVYQMTPHIMVMPLPFKKPDAHMGTKYEVDHPHENWIMAPNTPFEHLMVHFPADDVKAMMNPAP